ncbi:MAG: OsmC family protein [Desulfuromonadales bacterium]|nr:OsmC family protein [Desulfuromonadales bacterium]
MQTHGQKINGIAVDQLRETIDNIKQDPGLAKCTFRAQNRWISGGHNQALVSDFHGANQDIPHRQTFKLEIDEPPLLLGEDFGANPVEYVLTALSGCLTSSLIYHAAAQGITIEEVESELEGDLDLRGFLGISNEVRNGYNQINVKFKVKADAPQEKIDELIELAQQRSPVFDIVSHPVNVMVTGEKVAQMEVRH